MRTPILAALVFVACGDASEATSTGFSTAVTTRPAGTESTSTGDGSSSTSSTSTSTSSGEAGSDSSTAAPPVLDMGVLPDFGGDPTGCKGKLDFLFVISRTGVMWESQENFIKAFPKFIDTIRGEFDDFDVHIMVVDSEQKWTVDKCDKQCNGPCDVAPGYPCDYFPSACDETMGAGTIYNAGPYTENAPCGLDERRYMTTADLDTPGLFECLARVGTAGANKMGDALVAAVSPKLNGPGGCNDGFIRPDALLVLTMIGPEDGKGNGGSSKGTWQEWRQAVVDAKGGNANAIVALGIISGDTCLPNTDPVIRLCDLIPSFPNSLLEHLTLDDYGPTFKKGAEMALDACTLFIPG